jgi:hypothetical protein
MMRLSSLLVIGKLFEVDLARKHKIAVRLLRRLGLSNIRLEKTNGH